MGSAGIGVIVSIGDKIPCKRFGKIHSRFEHVLNFHLDDHIVSIVTSKIDAGPFRIVIDEIDLSTISEARLTLDELRINHTFKLPRNTGRAYNSAWKSNDIDIDLLHDNVLRLKQTLLENCSEKSICFSLTAVTYRNSVTPFDEELSKQFQQAYSKLMENDSLGAVDGFRGRGYGLTPAGDDYNIGLLMGLKIRQQCEKKVLSNIRSSIYTHSLGNNLLINTFLLQAYHGWYNENWKKLLTVLTGHTPEMENVVKSILAQGETSGADTLTGFISAWELQL